MDIQKPNDQLKELEEEANRFYASGNIAGALETLEIAIGIEKRWYHLYTKASWLYDLEKSPACWDTIQEGLARFPTHRFWFFYLRARYRYLTISSDFSKNPNTQAIINESIESQKDIDTALELVRVNADNIKGDLENLSLLFPQGWKGCDVNDVIHKVQNLRNEILSTYRTINLFSYINETQEELEKRVEIQKQEMKKEELQHQSNLEYYKAQNEFKLESVKIVNQAGQSALKACVFLNAGSAVAMLAFLANIWDKTKSSDIGLNITIAVSLFAFGALLGSISTGFTYLGLYAADVGKNKLWYYLNLSANGLIVISYNLFIIGGYLSLVGIGKNFGLNLVSIKLFWIILIIVNIIVVATIYNILKMENKPNEANNG